MKTLNTAELNDDDAENASNAEVAEFIVAQHESKKENETSMNNANHHHESGDCNNNNINKLEEQGLEQPSSPTSLTFKHHKIPREQWNNKIEYMLSVIGYVVDLGNCVRFPYVTYKNGGGAFLIPYFVFLLLIGVPMMYLEMSIGQYCKVGNIKLWEKVNVYMKGIGYASLLCVCFITLYYATIIAYSVYYLFASFSAVLPWSTCDNEWNTDDCFQRVLAAADKRNQKQMNESVSGVYSSNVSNTSLLLSSPAEEYFNRHVLNLHLSTGIDNLGFVKLDTAGCLAVVFLLMYVCVFTGVKSTGKAVYVTATLPYIILFFLLIHGISLEGSRDGVIYFITPTFEKLTDFGCWKDAAIQIFFTLGPGISVLTTYSSYSKFTNNCQIDAISASIANVIASFLAGIVVFSSLGHLSHSIQRPISEVARDDLGLSFIAYPEILATFRYAGFFSFIFFLMIFTLGLDSCFGGLEAIYASLADEFAVIKRHRKSSMALIHVMLFLGSLPTVTYGGMYLVTFLDTFSTSPALMLIVFFEAVSVSWFYGLPRFERNIKDMFQIDVSLYFKICWKFVGPAIIFALFFISIVLFQEPVVNNYRFPFAYLVFGWLINISIMLPIPGYVVYKYFALKIGNNSRI